MSMEQAAAIMVDVRRLRRGLQRMRPGPLYDKAMALLKELLDEAEEQIREEDPNALRSAAAEYMTTARFFGGRDIQR